MSNENNMGHHKILDYGAVFFLEARIDWQKRDLGRFSIGEGCGESRYEIESGWRVCVCVCVCVGGGGGVREPGSRVFI